MVRHILPLCLDTDRAPVSCDVTTGCLLQPKSLYSSVCEMDQLRTFRKLAGEKQPETNPHSVVPRGAFEHPASSGPGDTTISAADHNIVSDQSYYTRRGSCPVIVSDPNHPMSFQTAMVLPKSHLSAGGPPSSLLGTEGCTSSAPSSRTTKTSYPYYRPVAYPPSLFSSSSSSLYSSLPSEQELRTLATHSVPYVMILSHPSDTVVSIGERAEFTCKAIVQGSVQKPRYLWYKGNQPLVWEIGQRCVVERVCVDDAGDYLCLVSDPQGQVTVKSCSASLTGEVKRGGGGREGVLW